MNINSFFKTIETSTKKNTQPPKKQNIKPITHNNIFKQIITLPFRYGNYTIQIPEKFDNEFLFNIAGINKIDLMPIEQIIFFDLETIGLSIGAGNYPFLIGLLYIKKKQIYIKQYFIDNVGKLPLFLKEISDILKQHNYIITYNGKTFDIHILKNQLLLNQLDKSFIDNLVHIDLLHIARRIWKQELNNFSLGTIEEKIIKFIRQDDVPGYEIANYYFEFLRTGNWQLIFPILEHNKNDIISLLALLLLINNNKINSSFNKQQQHNILYFFHKQKKYQEVIEFYEEYNSIDNQILEIIADTYKKMKKHQQAEKLWEKIQNINSLIELAKLYEFKIKDFKKALDYSKIALSKINGLIEKNYYFKQTINQELKNNIQNRITRLKRKIEKNEN